MGKMEAMYLMVRKKVSQGALGQEQEAWVEQGRAGLKSFQLRPILPGEPQSDVGNLIYNVCSTPTMEIYGTGSPEKSENALPTHEVKGSAFQDFGVMNLTFSGSSEQTLASPSHPLPCHLSRISGRRRTK